MKYKALACLAFCLIFSAPVAANTTESYTVLDAKKYEKQVDLSRKRIVTLQSGLKPYRQQTKNTQVAIIVKQLENTPYLYNHAMGEGDWQSRSWAYVAGGKQIQQDPIYRVDGFDCQTFTQFVIALLYSNNLTQFDHIVLKNAYGATKNPSGDIVQFYNRNHFVDGDFNPINEKQGILFDATSQGALKPYAHFIDANITRTRWFSMKQKNTHENVRVLHEQDGDAMVQQFHTLPAHLTFPHFNSENITTSYIPKETLAIQTTNGQLAPNQELLDAIPTPAVVEIVRDPRHWMVHGKPIKEIIGSETTISHMGLLYRKTFQKGDVIYQKILCTKSHDQQKTCQVQPIICEKSQCTELMFVHATDSHPHGFYWYQASPGKFVCTSHLPPATIHATPCNRVEQLPLFDYLTDFQQGARRYLTNSSILGIHIEGLR